MRCKAKPEASKLAKQPAPIQPINNPKSLQIELPALGRASLSEFDTLPLSRQFEAFLL